MGIIIGNSTLVRLSRHQWLKQGANLDRIATGVADNAPADVDLSHTAKDLFLVAN
jgi:hypothetical protein